MSDLELLQRVMDAAEVLSSAMVESEAKDADYEMVEEPWSHLTAAIQAVYEARRKAEEKAK
jgi:hypothetical protein